MAGLTEARAGYRSVMKIPFGFVLGFAAGAYTYSKLTDEQRAGIADRIDRFATTGRTGKVADSIRRGVGGVADVATERVTEATDTVTDAAASAIASDDSPSYASN